MTIQVSVVVPTRDRPDLLDRCLDALLNQEFPSDSYEIVVADDSRSESVRARISSLACASHSEGPTVRYVAPCSASGPAAARNVGWQVARGRIIAFTDDDCIPARDWLSRGVEEMGRGWVMVGGRVHVSQIIDPTDYERNASHLGESDFVTANCFVRREALETLGGFDERFRMAWREDSDLLFRAIAMRMPIGRASDAVVSHPTRAAKWGVSLRQQRKSMYNALLYKKHPDLYRERVQHQPPWRYYRILSAGLVGLTGLVLRSRGVALGGVAVWGLLTGRFCMARLQGTKRTPEHIVEMVVTSAMIPPLSVFWRLRGAIRFRVFFL